VLSVKVGLFKNKKLPAKSVQCQESRSGSTFKEKKPTHNSIFDEKKNRMIRNPPSKVIFLKLCLDNYIFIQSQKKLCIFSKLPHSKGQ